MAYLIGKTRFLKVSGAVGSILTKVTRVVREMPGHPPVIRYARNVRRACVRQPRLPAFLTGTKRVSAVVFRVDRTLQKSA